MTKCFYPLTIYKDLFLAYAVSTAHGFLLDDLILEKKFYTKEQTKRYIDRNLEQAIFILQFWEYSDEFFKHGHPGNSERLVDANYEWVLGTITGSSDVVYHPDMSLDEYHKYKHQETGCTWVFVAGQIGSLIYLDNELVNCDEMKKVKFHFDIFPLFLNDLFCLKKEKNDTV